MPAIIDFVTLPMEANLQLTATVYLVIMLIVNDVFVRFTIMKLKYILIIILTLFAENSSFTMYRDY